MQQFHVTNNLGERFVSVSSHDYDFDVFLDLSYLARGFDAVNARRHSDINVGNGNGTIRFSSRFDNLVGFFSASRMKKLKLR